MNFQMICVTVKKLHLLRLSLWQCYTLVSPQRGGVWVGGEQDGLGTQRVSTAQITGHTGPGTGIISSTSCETLRLAVPVWNLFQGLFLMHLPLGCVYLWGYTDCTQKLISPVLDKSFLNVPRFFIYRIFFFFNSCSCATFSYRSSTWSAIRKGVI